MILREFAPDGPKHNKDIGDHYVLIDFRVPDKFSETSRIRFGDVPTPENCYAFIIHSKGSEIIPLWKNSHYYIMTDGGQTFENLTFKP